VTARSRRAGERSPKNRDAAFDAAYFQRYYFSRRTRVVTAAEMRARAALIAAILRQTQIPVGRILDAGCGIGLLRAPFAKLLPRAAYTGLEASAYLCEHYGWTSGSVADYRARRAYDLVVCYDVLQYLSDRDAARAIANLGRLSRAALYVSALTSEDWRDNCDRSLTDRDVHLRPAAWYRRRLSAAFRHLGFGVWIRRNVRPICWELERSRGAVKACAISNRRAPHVPVRRPPSRPAHR